MILGKIFNFYKKNIFSGTAIATPASQLQCPKIFIFASGHCNCDAGVTIAAPTGGTPRFCGFPTFLRTSLNSPVGVAIAMPGNI